MALSFPATQSVIAQLFSKARLKEHMDAWAEAQVLSSWTSIIYAEFLDSVTETEWAPKIKKF